MKLKITNKSNEVYEVEAASYEEDRRSGKSKSVIVYNDKDSPIAYISQVINVEEIK